jgi:uncharacterized protein (DUF488 family)
MPTLNRSGVHRLFTIGHGTHPLDGFMATLQSFGINLVVDVRTIPRSRHNPQFNKETLPASLRPQGIDYRHWPGLGGLRKARPDSVNSGWRNASFRGFADYMQGHEFETNLEELIKIASQSEVVLMCAETLPWRCHRSLIADALLVRGIPVTHILKIGSSQEHRMTSFLRVSGTALTYPKPEAE